MKIGAIIRSYHLTDYLRAVLTNLAWVDKIIVANYRFLKYPWSEKKYVPEAEDKTEEICKKLNQSNVVLMKGETKDQTEVFDLSQREMLGFGLVFIVDADEFLLKDDQGKIVEEMLKNPNPAARVNMIDYATMDRVYPMRTHKQLIAIKPPIKFQGTRGCEGGVYLFKDINLHHFGYMLKDQKWKSQNLWYPRESYDRIVCNSTIPYEMPKELKELLNE